MPRFILIAVFVLLQACTPKQGQQPADRVDRYFQAHAEASRFSGVVLIARDDTVLLEKGYGWSDLEHRVPLRADSMLRIGSLTKPMTASAVLIAVNAGLLTLEDELCQHLANLPEGWCTVTIRQLLSHTSGIPDLFGELEEVPVEATAEELTRMLGALEPEQLLGSPAGEEYSYSNFNYVLLGVILEQIYQSPWEHVLETTIWQPLKLQSTAYDDVWAITRGRARGYRRASDGLLANIEYSDHAAYAAGGLASTVGDLFSWSNEVFSSALIGPELTRNSLTPVLGNYGLGWQIRELFGQRMINHSGGIDGFSSHLAYYPDEQLTIIVLSNVENDSAFVSACDAAALWFEVREQPSNPLRWLEMENRQRCGLT